MASGTRQRGRRGGRRGRGYVDPPAPENDWMQAMLQAMQTQAAATNNLANLMAQQQQQPQPVPQPPPPTHQGGANHTFNQFFKMKPPTFTGKEGAMASRHWLEAMERIFKVVQCTEAHKVTFATHLLGEGAVNWWKGARG